MRKILSIILCALLLIGTFPFAAIAEELNENVDEAIVVDVADEAQAEDSNIAEAEAAETEENEPLDDEIQTLAIERAVTNGYSYEIRENAATGTQYAVITKYSGSSADVVIPASLGGYPVEK